MFCALLTSRYQVSVYRTNGPLVLWRFGENVLRPRAAIVCFVTKECALVNCLHEACQEQFGKDS